MKLPANNCVNGTYVIPLAFGRMLRTSLPVLVLSNCAFRTYVFRRIPVRNSFTSVGESVDVNDAVNVRGSRRFSESYPCGHRAFSTPSYTCSTLIDTEALCLELKF